MEPRSPIVAFKTIPALTHLEPWLEEVMNAASSPRAICIQESHLDATRWFCPGKVGRVGFRLSQEQYAWIFVLHHPDRAYPYLYVATIAGQGGIDDRSMLDAKRVLGSWTWGE